MAKMFWYVIERLKEPTTWVGLGTLATAIGWQISPEMWQQIAAIGLGVGGLLSIVLREKAA